MTSHREEEQDEETNDSVTSADGLVVNSSQDEDEEGNIVEPLVSTEDPRRSRIALSITRDQSEDADCWGDTWKPCASFVMTAILLAPLVFSHFQHRSSWLADRSQNITDTVSCFDRLNFSDITLMESMKEENKSYCRSGLPHCRCLSTVVPVADAQLSEKWETAHQRNVNLTFNRNDVDVVFFGDSITEHWVGTDVGIANKKNEPVKEVFDEMFRKQNGAKYEGLALGISGDVCGQLLYRLQNGELPDTLNPPVIWVLIGANDLGQGCDAGVVVAGVIATVEYILRVRPNATVVINSLLPAMIANRTIQQTPLVQYSTWANERLDCYVTTQPRVQFFNATGLFIKDDHVVGMRDFVHPSGDGSRAWAGAIVKRLHKILG